VRNGRFWSAAARRRFLSLCFGKGKKKESGVEPPHSKGLEKSRDALAWGRPNWLNNKHGFAKPGEVGKFSESLHLLPISRCATASEVKIAILHCLFPNLHFSPGVSESADWIVCKDGNIF